jgi:hypothetical protein
VIGVAFEKAVRRKPPTQQGGGNTASGEFALEGNTTGFANTATGGQALQSNTTGLGNTADGALALDANTLGSFNTDTSDAALVANTTGSNNTALGYNAGPDSGHPNLYQRHRDWRERSRQCQQCARAESLLSICRADARMSPCRGLAGQRCCFFVSCLDSHAIRHCMHQSDRPSWLISACSNLASNSPQH